MYNRNNIKQLIKNKQHRLGSHREQQLLFSLVYLILCYALCQYGMYSVSNVSRLNGRK